MAQTKKNQLPKINALIIGATGTLGRQLIDRFMKNPRIDKIIGLALEPKPYYFNDYNEKRFIYIKANILRERDIINTFLHPVFRESTPIHVIHLATRRRSASTSNGGPDLNVQTTKRLIEYCLATESIKRFVYLSSYAVYKLTPDNSALISEDDDLNFSINAPQWIRDQVDADMICRSFLDNTKMTIAILRPTEIIGRNIHSLLNGMVESNFLLKVMGYNPMINPIHANDVLQAIETALLSKARGVFNISGKEKLPIKSFFNLSGKPVINIPSPLIFTVNQTLKSLGILKTDFRFFTEGLMFSSLLDTNKIKKEMGFVPEQHIKF